jgi:hypothetical protein
VLAALCLAVGAWADDPARPFPHAESTVAPPQGDARALRASVKFAPYRYDDILWENDRTAHRIYGPALQKYEPPSGSGIDAWGKLVSWPFMERQLATGKQHDFHGEGLDFYSVGATRGAGGLGVWFDNKLWTSRNWSSYRIYRDGPDIADFSVTYAPWPVDVRRIVRETRRFTLPLGSNFTRMVSKMDSNQPGLLEVGIGIARRPTSEKPGHFIADAAHGRFTFWSPEDPDKGAMGVALLVDPAMIAEVTQDADNFLVVVKVKPGSPFVYYMGATWSRRGDFPDEAKWVSHVAAHRADFAVPRPPR